MSHFIVTCISAVCTCRSVRLSTMIPCYKGSCNTRLTALGKAYPHTTGEQLIRNYHKEKIRNKLLNSCTDKDFKMFLKTNLNYLFIPQ